MKGQPMLLLEALEKSDQWRHKMMGWVVVSISMGYDQQNVGVVRVVLQGAWKWEEPDRAELEVPFSGRIPMPKSGSKALTLLALELEQCPPGTLLVWHESENIKDCGV